MVLDTLKLTQDFAFGFAQSLIVEAICRWKSQKDEREASQQLAWLGDVEASRPYADRIAQKITVALKESHIQKHDTVWLQALAFNPISKVNSGN